MIDLKNLPPLRSRDEMLGILLKQEYGVFPPEPEAFEFETAEDTIRFFCAGKAKLNHIIAKFRLNGKEFKFPFNAVIPTAPGKHPFFIHINFRDCVPDRYMPTEEIVDNGFAILSFCYTDITSDNGDFDDGLAGVYYGGRERKNNDAGKIALWAWAAMRVMDYAQGLDSLDMEKAAVCGHSRLGKTALLCAAADERFKFAFSNDSGCSGGAITRNKSGETLEKIYAQFPFWFCKNYGYYTKTVETMPFDQHYLLACIYPRNAYVASAENDPWSDPAAEYECCKAAQKLLGLPSVPAEMPAGGIYNFDGKIGYHIRKGDHYFSRYDWNMYMNYIRKF